MLIAGEVLLPIPVLAAGIVAAPVPVVGLLPIPERIVLLVLASPPVWTLVFTPGGRSPERTGICKTDWPGVRTMTEL